MKAQIKGNYSLGGRVQRVSKSLSVKWNTFWFVLGFYKCSNLSKCKFLLRNNTICGASKILPSVLHKTVISWCMLEITVWRDLQQICSWYSDKKIFSLEAASRQNTEASSSIAEVLCVVAHKLKIMYLSRHWQLFSKVYHNIFYCFQPSSQPLPQVHFSAVWKSTYRDLKCRQYIIIKLYLALFSLTSCHTDTFWSCSGKLCPSSHCPFHDVHLSPWLYFSNNLKTLWMYSFVKFTL